MSFHYNLPHYKHIDDDEIAYFTLCWKTRKLVLSTAPKTWNNTDKDSKKQKTVPLAEEVNMAYEMYRITTSQKDYWLYFSI